MKRTHLADVLRALEHIEHIIKVPETIRIPAFKAVQKMLEIKIRTQQKKIALTQILGRKVDLRTSKGLNRYFREEVLHSAEVQVELDKIVEERS